MQELLQRYSVANCSEVVLQTNLDVRWSLCRPLPGHLLRKKMLTTTLQALSSADAPINVLQSAVKREIFKPIFMNFPVLDRFPFPSRARARRMVNRFKQELRHALTESQRPSHLSAPTASSFDGLGPRMLAAKESGLWNEKQLLDNLTVAFVAGQENPQLCMISTLYLLAKHPVRGPVVSEPSSDLQQWCVQDAQTRLYEEIQGSALGDHGALNLDVLQEMPFLTAVIYESLRLFPPIGQLVNRQASENALLGGEIAIPKGMYIGYNCYSTNRDPDVWGPAADDFDPSRWGDSPVIIQKQYRQRRARAEFTSFHGGRRACLGEKFAMLQMRVTLVALVRAFTWTLDPAWVDRKTPVSSQILDRTDRFLAGQPRACWF